MTAIHGRSIPELIRSELEELQVPAPVSALRALAGVARGERIPAERMGRILGYERERYMRTRHPPRLASGLSIDGTPLSPPRLAIGSWRLGRRLVVSDALVGHSAVLGIRICERALRLGADAADELRPSALQASQAVLGATGGEQVLTAPAEWEWLRFQLLAARPGGGADSMTTTQYDAESRLQAAGITGVAQYFGAAGPIGAVHTLGLLRRPLPGEQGEPFDDLVRRRAGAPAVAREVLAFVQEWGDVADGLERTATLADYAERWKVTEAEARRRLEIFQQVLPGESDPGPVWSLLWEGVEDRGRRDDSLFVRLTSIEVIDTVQLPDLLEYFLASLYDQLGTGLGRELRQARLESGLSSRRESFVPGRELRRLYALADLALHGWVAAALEVRGSSIDVAGLRNLEHIYDDAAAGDAQEWVGSLRRGNPGPGLQKVLLRAQRCLRVCSELSPLEPPTASAALLPGVRLAAGTLAAASREGAVDVVQAARTALELLTTTR